MKLHESDSSEVELTFLVSRDGIATLSVDIGLAATKRLRASGLPPGANQHSALRPLDLGTDPLETMFEPGAWAIDGFREPIEEVEMAAKAKDVAALLRVARRLAAESFMRQVFEGKTGRNGLIANAPRVAKISGGMAASDAFTLVARSCLNQVSASAQLLRQNRNAEALHQCRVGLRRLRAALTIFKSILPREDLDRWKVETKWLAGELDAARDLDAFVAHVSRSTNAQAQGDPILLAFGERLVLAQAIAYDPVLAAVESKRFAALLMDLTEWVEAAPWPCDDDPMAASLGEGNTSVLAAQALKRLHGRLRKAGKHLGKLDQAGRHEVRIKAKKLRYAAEFFSETFGESTQKRHKNFISSLTRLQDALGELNDMVTAGQCARGVVGRSADLAFCAGQIVGNRNSNEPLLLAEAVRAYRQWSELRPFWA